MFKILKIHNVSILLVFAILLIAFLFLNSYYSFSDMNGRVERTLATSEGCGGTNCHGPVTPNPATVIAIESGTGGYSVKPGTITNYTVTVRNDISTAAGINISVKDISGANVGTLSNVQNDLKVVSGELTHTTPKILEGGIASFSFTWQAPMTQGTYTFNVAACGVNMDNLATAQDMWSWMFPQDIVVDAGPPILACNPSGIDFREVKFTRYKDTTITVKNAGKNPLSVTGIELSGPNASEFTLPGSYSLFDLLPDSTRVIKVRFTPANMLGSKTAYINFTNNSAENPKVVYLAGNCNSQPTPIITVSSELIDFGDVKVTAFKELELNVKNSGDYDLTINSANLSGVNAKDFSFASATNFLLKPDSSTKILVRFNPLSTGNKAAQFNFSSTAKNDPIIYLVGKALPGPKPMIQFSVNPLVFGKTAVGTKSDKPVVIKNAGEIPLEVTAMKILGSNATEFSFVSGGGGFALDANEQKSISIRFTPIVEGTDKTAYIEFTSNDDSKPQLQLSAEAYSIPKPKIQSSVAEIDFGQINNTFTKDTTFSIFNKGSLDLKVDQPYLSGNDSLEFAILTQAFPRNVIPDDVLSIRIRFQPKFAGGKSTFLMIPSSDIQLKIPLGGVSKPYTGVEDSQPENFSVQIIPNPSASKIRFIAAENDCRQLRIYDNAGSLLIEFRQNSAVNFEWDMKDSMNRTVANGIYHAVFSSGTKQRSVSFVVSK